MDSRMSVETHIRVTAVQSVRAYETNQSQKVCGRRLFEAQCHTNMHRDKHTVHTRSLSFSLSHTYTNICGRSTYSHTQTIHKLTHNRSDLYLYQQHTLSSCYLIQALWHVLMRLCVWKYLCMLDYNIPFELCLSVHPCWKKSNRHHHKISNGFTGYNGTCIGFNGNCKGTLFGLCW